LIQKNLSNKLKKERKTLINIVILHKNKKINIS